MQIQLFGNDALVTSVAAELHSCGLHILINTFDRESYVHYRGGSINYAPEHFEQWSHTCFAIIKEEFDNECEIVFIPESEEEYEMLRQPHYVSAEKDQVYIQYVNTLANEFKKTVASWSASKVNPKMTVLSPITIIDVGFACRGLADLQSGTNSPTLHSRLASLKSTNPYFAKDLAKAARANKFIGRGSLLSSTHKYMVAAGDLANCGTYTHNDRVFISVEGARVGRVPL